jgi:hypothetical protein
MNLFLSLAQLHCTANSNFCWLQATAASHPSRTSAEKTWRAFRRRKTHPICISVDWHRRSAHLQSSVWKLKTHPLTTGKSEKAGLSSSPRGVDVDNVQIKLICRPRKTERAHWQCNARVLARLDKTATRRHQSKGISWNTRPPPLLFLSWAFCPPVSAAFSDEDVGSPDTSGSRTAQLPTYHLPGESYDDAHPLRYSPCLRITLRHANHSRSCIPKYIGHVCLACLLSSGSEERRRESCLPASLAGTLCLARRPGHLPTTGWCWWSSPGRTPLINLTPWGNPVLIMQWLLYNSSRWMILGIISALICR